MKNGILRGVLERWLQIAEFLRLESECYVSQRSIDIRDDVLVTCRWYITGWSVVFVDMWQ